MPKKVKDNVRVVQDFYTLVTDAHIVAAAMCHFNMTSLEDEPSGITLPTEVHALSDFMMQTVGQLIDKHVTRFTKMSDISNPDTSSLLRQQQSDDQEDQVMNYASLVIGFGLMANNFHDAWREGDGERLLRCWKFLLLHFKGNGRTKYAVEAVRLISQTSALLSPRKAHQLIWNRTCNPKGGHGNNIPLDLQNEFMNRLFKDSINTFPSNITTSSVDRSAQSVKQVHDILDNFDNITHSYKDKGEHIPPDISGDFQLVLHVLLNENIFKPTPGRAHSSFRKISADPLIFLT